MASTVLRVKRRLEDNPQDALVLMCKRIKTDTEDISPSLFVFRGTVASQETQFTLSKHDAKFYPKNCVSDIIQKIRKERKETSAENRYDVIKCSRGLKDNNDDISNEHFDLIDLQPKSCDEDDWKYIYDLYTTPEKDFDLSMLDNLISIEHVETDLIFGSNRDNGQVPSSEESDDSNDENNWRNDYPDSEPSSIDEEDIVNAMGNCHLENDLSSDTDEDNIYNEPTDLFNEDVKRYGRAYAKYKARILSEEQNSNANNFVHSTVKDLDEESIDGYKDDADDDGFYYGQDEETEQFREQYKDYLESQSEEECF